LEDAVVLSRLGLGLGRGRLLGRQAHALAL
jgi:hypothetical protein